MTNVLDHENLDHTPNPALHWAYDLVARRGHSPRTALDIGCGRGRNSLFLAKAGVSVTSFDFTPEAIHTIEAAADAQGLRPKIRALCHDVTEDWPVSDHAFDLIIDLHCFRHIHDHDLRENYKRNILRSLCVHGRYLIAIGMEGDGYYGRYAANEAGLLHTKKQILSFFAPGLSLDSEWGSPDEHSGDQKKPFALLLQRNPHVVG